MIRFIDLGKQYWEENEFANKSFAFINTVTDRFVEFNTNQFWDTKEDFTEDYKQSGYECIPSEEGLERFLSLIPEDWGE